jgi:hypothetical protein
VLDEASGDTLQTVRAAAAYSGHHGYARSRHARIPIVRLACGCCSI